MLLQKKALPALLFGLMSLALPGNGAAQAIVSTGESFVDATLIPGETAADGSRMAGLVLDLKPGWKTYWRNPGDAGIPPEFDWSRSRNLKGAEVLWPRPSFFDSFGLKTIGYEDRVVFPVRLEPEEPGQPIELGLDLRIGVCQDICVLEETDLALLLEPGDSGHGSAMIEAAAATVPPPASEAGLTAATCRIAGTGRERSFDATLDFGRPLEDASVILEGPGLSWFENVETVEKDGKLHVTAELSLVDGSAWVGRSDVRMTVLAGDLAADVRGCSAPAG